MANAAIDSPRGTAFDMESYRTVDTEPTATTRNRARFGAVANATTNGTQAHSFCLSDEERLTLARIRRNRKAGFMATFEEFDFLLEIAERCAR